MSRLNDAISNVAYILDTLMVYRNIENTGNCNNCKHYTSETLKGNDYERY